jgi:GT2 family glycosyltransferase
MAEREGQLAPHGMAVVDRILRGVPLNDAYGACSTCAQMARLSTYRIIGGFDNNLRRCDDTEFNIRFAKAGGHFVGVSEPQVIQYMNWAPEKSLDEEHRNMLLILEKHRDVMDRFGQYDFCRHWLEGKYAFHEGHWATFFLIFMSLFLRHPLWTLQRFLIAVPNISLNRTFSRFHMKTRPDR